MYKLESVFSLTTPSVLSNYQDFAESDNVLVRFALTLKTAMLANGLWAIKITNLILGAKKFREVFSKDRSLAYLKILLSDVIQVVRQSMEGTLRCIKFASGQINNFA